jgi:hypothetical protein
MNMADDLTRRGFLYTGAVASLAAGVPGQAAPAAEADPADRIRVPANYYQQFDADYTRDVPAEGYGGWKRAEVELSRAHTAVVVMHAWDCGSLGTAAGCYRRVEYLPRAGAICRDVFPRLLGTVRQKQVRLFHVVGGRDYYSGYPGSRRARELARPSPPVAQVRADATLQRLREFRRDHVLVGPGNEVDTRRENARRDFAPEARPVGDEGIAEDGRQLFALCEHHGINHLIYAGFAIDGCLLMSPGGMVDMSRHGVMCSTFRQAVTAIENKETARRELAKEVALWRVAVVLGFVFDVDDFLGAIA